MFYLILNLTPRTIAPSPPATMAGSGALPTGFCKNTTLGSPTYGVDYSVFLLVDL